MTQPNLKIDYDRGVTKKLHPTGVAVYMYADEPGVYRNAFGTIVSDELAEQAGYDLKQLGKLRLKRERMAAAMEAINAELESGEIERIVVEERDGFQLVDIGYDRFNVEDPDGNVLNPVPLTKVQAKPLFDKLAPQPVEEAPKPKGKPFGIPFPKAKKEEVTDDLGNDSDNPANSLSGDGSDKPGVRPAVPSSPSGGSPVRSK